MKKRSSRIIAMIMAALMVITAVPAEHLLSVKASGTAPEVIETYVNEKQHFTADDYDTVKEYYDICVANSYTGDYVKRLENAYNALSLGVYYYDDFDNIGEYVGEKDSAGYQKEPTNAGDYFPTTKNDTNYEIMWGGLYAQRLEGKPGSYPTAFSFNSTTGFQMYPFHFTNYFHDGAANDQTSTMHYGSRWWAFETSRCENYEDAWDKFNFLTLKEERVDETEDGIDVFGGKLKVYNSPFLIYNYIDRDNWSGVQINNLRSIESVDGVITPEPRYNQYGYTDLTRENIGAALPNYTTKDIVIDFQAIWNEGKGCYTLTLTSNEEGGGTISVDLNKSSQTISKMDNLLITTMFPSFDGKVSEAYESIYFSYNIVPFLEAQIEQRVPEESEITRLMVSSLENYHETIKSFGDVVYAQLTNISKLTDAIEIAKNLQAQYEAQFSLSNIVLDAEDGHPLEYEDYFKVKGGVTVRDNPNKDATNSSNKAFYLKGKTTVPFIDKLGGRVAMVSGKTNGSLQMHYAYKDDNNYEYVAVGGTKGGSSINYAYGGKNQGAGFGSYSNDLLLPEGVTQATDWIYFTIRINGSEIHLSYAVLGTDGKYYYETVEHGYSNVFQEDMGIAFYTQAPAGIYLDDLTFNYQGTDAFYNIESFFSVNEYILNLNDYAAHISASDSAEYEELMAGYNALTPNEKLILGDVTRQKVADIQAAYAAANESDAKALDAKWLQYAKDNYTLANTAFVRRYQAFKSTDDDDSTSQWEYGHRQWGQAEIKADATLGRNVLRLSSDGTLLLKEKFMPEKAVVQEMSYKIRGIGDTTPKKPEGYTFYVTDPKIVVYLYYKDEANRSFIAFYENQWGTYTYQNGKEIRTFTAYDETNALDITTTLSVSYKNTGGSVAVYVTDEHETLFEYKTTYNANEKNRLALGCYGSSRSVVKYGYDYKVEIWDIEAKLKKGDWDDDVTQTELRVNYTGNTYQSPGDVAVIRGENLGNLVQNVKLVRLSNTDTDTVGFIDRSSYDYDGVHEGEFTMNPKTPSINWNNARSINIVHKSTDSLQFIIPEDIGHGIYAVQLSGIVNRVLKTKVVYLNVPVIDYTLGSDGEFAVPGEKMDIVGENIAPNQNANADSKAADKRVKDRDIDDLKVKLISKANPSENYDLEIVEITSDYHIVVKIPSEITATDTATEWQLSVYNGYGDGTAWSIPKIVKIKRSFADSQAEKYPTYINIRDYGGTGHYKQNVTPILQQAINDLYENYGGGTIYLPEGTYRLEYTVYLPENIRIVGDGKALTNILPTYFDWNYGTLFDKTGFLVSNNCEISGVGFYIKRAKQVITANGVVNNFTFSDIKFYTNVEGWSNNGMGAGNPLIDRNDIFKYRENGSANGMLCGVFTNFKMLDVYSDYNNNELNMFVDYDPTSNYGRFENVIDNDASNTWNRAIYNNAIWRDCQIQGTSATQGRNVYMHNVKFGPATSYNREIWVADLSGWTGFKFRTLPGDDGTLENSVYLEHITTTGESVGIHEWMATCQFQIYVRSGNGAGQTRQIVGVDTEKNAFIIDRPFDVPINRNSVLTVRQPREDIYFVDCEWYEGGCAGGFFGGCADVVYDGNYYNYAMGVYWEGIFGDVNWYVSNLNAVWENTPYGLIASFGMSKAKSYMWLEDATNLANAHLGMLIRNCDVINMPMENSSYGSNRQYDFIIDNNRFNDMEYIMSFSKSGIPDGLTFYRNTGNKLVAYAKNNGLSGTNGLGYSYAVLLDDNFKEIEAKLLGDANQDGVVNLDDVNHTQYAIAGKVDLSMSAFAAADVDGDGAVTAMDATLIRYYVLGMLDRFPADTTPPGEDEDDPQGPNSPGGGDTGDDSGDLDVDDNVGSDDDYTPGYH